MWDRIASNSPVTKAVRVALVFVLVFGMSFGAEGLAFAAIKADGGEGHDAQTLVNLAVHEAALEDGEWHVGQEVRDARGTADKKDQAHDLRVSAAGGTINLVALATWEDAPENDKPADPPGGGGGESGGGSGSGGTTQPPAGGDDGNAGNDDNAGGGEEEGSREETVEDQSVATRGMVSPQADDDDPVTVADFVKWEVDDESAAKVEWKDGVATLTGQGTESKKVTVTVTLAKGYRAAVPADFGDDFKVEFSVYVEAPYIGSIAIHRPPTGDGAAVPDDAPLELDESERSGFAFWAQVEVWDSVQTDTYPLDSTADSPLSKASDGRFADLEWSVVNAEGTPVEESEAKIDPATGLFELSGDGPVFVRCTSQQGSGGEPIWKQVEVRSSDAPKDLQGAFNPQDSLTVKIDRPAKAAASEGESEQDGESGDDSGTAEGDQTAADEADGEGGQPATPTEEEQPAEGAEDGAPSAEAETPPAVYSKTFENQATGAVLDVNEKTYTMTLDGERRAITGKGTTLPLLLADAGIDFGEGGDEIESIEFVNANNTVTKMDWSELAYLTGSEQTYVVVASESYVHESQPDAEAGADAEPGEDGQGAAPELLENTRFRILFQQPEDSSLNAEDLCWVNTIIVHVKGEPEPDDGPKTDLGVSIDYIPVPKGADAYLTAIPNEKIGGAKFDYKWYRSTDDKANWDDCGADGVQTLIVKTDDEHIGNWYKVQMTTDKLDENGDYITVESDPVQVVEGEGFIVLLDYIPPLAGTDANFEARVVVSEGQTMPSRIQYEWEAISNGESQPLGSGIDMKTYSIPTNAVDENDTSDDSSPIIYIRVKATSLDEGDDRSGVSNRCPLTVRVGDSSGDPQSPGGSESGGGKSDDVERALNGGVTPDVEDGNDGEPEDESRGDDGRAASDGRYSVTRIDAPQQADAASMAGTTPTDASPADAAIYVDSKVSEQVKKQNSKKKTAQEATTPGARWTKLSVTPSSDEVANVLRDNPFAPFAVPLGMGLVVAGGLEQLISWRRKLG